MLQLPNKKMIPLISELWGNFRYSMLISSGVCVSELLEIINMKCQFDNQKATIRTLTAAGNLKLTLLSQSYLR